MYAVKRTDITGKDYAQNDAASAFFDSIAPKGGMPYICSEGARDCGQTWFHASGEQYRNSTINSNFFEQTAKYYNTASSVYNKEHLGQIDIAGSLYQNAQAIAGVNQAMTAVDEGMLPWECSTVSSQVLADHLRLIAPSKSNTGTATEAVPSGMRAYLGSKLEFLFGNASGTKKNIDRSQAMQLQLKSIGLNDAAATRSYVANHMNSILNDPSNIVRVQPDGRSVRESLLSGPTGIVKMETIWDGNKLITIKVFGGNP